MNDKELEKLVQEFVRKEKKQFEDILDYKVKRIYAVFGKIEFKSKSERQQLEIDKLKQFINKQKLDAEYNRYELEVTDE